MRTPRKIIGAVMCVVTLFGCQRPTQPQRQAQQEQDLDSLKLKALELKAKCREDGSKMQAEWKAKNYNWPHKVGGWTNNDEYV
jgi:hypothetical protein